ncbi:hypothetical protein V6N13_049616 [Hibiscus sabdariffa]|uniref:Uncharacterized protein n=1 Tax=Hibiscus sabdariffa TaxID=183260 RepID=A0ABR2QXB3_9ROSI
MNLDLVFLDDAGVDEELRDVLALVALELNDLAELFVLDDVAVAAEVLLQALEDLLVAQIMPQPLDRRQALLPVPLLDSDMNILFGPGAPEFPSLREWIECCRDLDVQINHVLGSVGT